MGLRPGPEALLFAAWLAVHRALELAGKRMLTREIRREAQGIPPWTMHTRYEALTEDCDALLGDAWEVAAAMLPELGPYTDVLDDYVRELLVDGEMPDRAELLDALRDAAAL